MIVADAAGSAEIARRIRTIPDFPKPGIQFRDITTLILDPEGLRLAVDAMVAAVRGPVDLVAGIEARGFVFAPAVALALGAGVLLVRDLIATGGTARAAVRLLRKAGAIVEQAVFAIDLPGLGGAESLRSERIGVSSLVAFPGD